MKKKKCNYLAKRIVKYLNAAGVETKEAHERLISCMLKVESDYFEDYKNQKQ